MPSLRMNCRQMLPRHKIGLGYVYQKVTLLSSDDHIFICTVYIWIDTPNILRTVMIHLRRHLVTCAKESIRTLYLSKSRTMCTFVSTISPITGKMEWVAKAENYDFHQEVAR